MPRIFLPVGAIACWTLLTAACNDKATIIDEGAAGTQAGSGGRSGATGVGGSRAGAAGDGSGGSAGDGSGGSAGDGSGGSAGDGAGGSDEPPDGGADPADATAPVSCSVDSDCADDGNPCTIHDCNPSGVCVTGNAAATVTCGSALDDACTNPDTCNGAGACIPNHAAEGLVCDANTDEEDDGHCTVGVCDCASERLTAPGQTSWETGSTDPDLVNLSCDGDCDNEPDHVVVFTAPSTGTYRFFAAASEGGESSDTSLAVMEGNCSPAPTVELGCNDDIVGADALIADSELDVALTAGQVVSVVITTPCENVGADGILRIELLPAP